MKVVLTRLAVMVPLFLIVVFAVFALVDLAPGDPAIQIAGENATEEELERVREALGLNDPLPTRYLSWLGDAVRGDLGTSTLRNQPVWELIVTRMGPTVSLGVVSLTLAIIVGGGLGIGSAIRKGGILDRVAAIFAAGGVALPAFWVGLLLVVFLSLDRGWFPATGYVPMGEGFGEWLRHLTLPALALGWLPAAEFTRHTRSAVSEVLERDYVLTAWAKGLRWPTIVRRHVLRNAGIPIVTVLGARIAAIVGGTVIIEGVFNIPGIGSLTVASVLARDMPVILGVVAVTTTAVLVVNYLVDMSYALLDPRARS